MAHYGERHDTVAALQGHEWHQHIFWRSEHGALAVLEGHERHIVASDRTPWGCWRGTSDIFWRSEQGALAVLEGHERHLHIFWRSEQGALAVLESYGLRTRRGVGWKEGAGIIWVWILS